MLLKAPTKRVKILMCGNLGTTCGVIQIGLHKLRDVQAYNVEYRNRSISIVDNAPNIGEITVKSLTNDTVSWLPIAYPALTGHPDELDNIKRLGDALNFLSMYENGVSQMMTLVNIRQNLLLNTESKVITDKPSAFLINNDGISKLARWSAEAVNKTIWV